MLGLKTKHYFRNFTLLITAGIIVLIGIEVVFLSNSTRGILILMLNSRVSDVVCSDVMEFCNMAKQANLAEELGYGRGAAFVDIDDDGWEDIWVSGNTLSPSKDGNGISKIFRNQRDGTFVSMDIGIEYKDLSMTYSGSFADFDNDGDSDLLMANGGYSGDATLALYRNDLKNKGVFIRVNEEANITEELRAWWGTSWADYDLDGWLDFIAVDRTGQAWLYHNLGNGTFEEVAQKKGIHAKFLNGKNPIWFDYTNNGYPDLFLAGYPNHYFYRNDGAGKFVDVTDSALILPQDHPVYYYDGSFAVVSADFNQDGLEDLYLGISINQDLVFINQGDGTLMGFSREAGLDMLTFERDNDSSEPTMGLGVGDINGNGYPDILIGTGDVCEKCAFVDLVYCNVTKSNPRYEVKFERCSDWVVQGHGKNRTHGIILGDPNHDGNVEIFFNLGGDPNYDRLTGYDSRSLNTFYVRNPEFSFNALNTATIHLVGTTSNRDAVGARIKIEGSETHYYTVQSAQGFQSQNSDWITVSLGDAESATIIVTWPSGNRTINAVQAGERITILEKE